MGYKDPLIDTRFKKGQSGNPRGPRREPRSAQEIARKSLHRTVVLVRDGRRERVGRLEAFFERLIDDAIKGAPTARRLLLNYLKDNPAVVKPRQVLRIIDETMSPQEAAEAYAATLRAIPGMTDSMDEIDFVKGGTVVDGYDVDGDKE